MHEPKEVKLSHLRSGIRPCLMGMGLSHRFAWALAVCAEPDTHSSPLMCFSYRVTTMGGRAVPSLPLMFGTNCKDHRPHRLPPASTPLGLQWVTASVTSQFCWITSQSNPGSLCSISTGVKRLQKSGKTKISTWTRIQFNFLLETWGLLYLNYASLKISCQNEVV